MNLDDFLGMMSVEQLQDLAAVWSEGTPRSSSKLAMFRMLRTEMTRPDRVRHTLELSDDFGRGIVRRLLRTRGVSHSMAVLAASSAARPRTLEETRSAVNDLAALGLVVVEPEKRWETYGTARVTIAEELIKPLREVTGIDERLPEEILNLADFLAAMPEKSLKQLVKKYKLPETETAPEALAKQLAEPSAARKRVEALSPDVREMVESLIRQRGGLVPVSRLHKELGLEVTEVKEASQELWRKELEANLLGTVGDVSLLEYGIDLDGKVLAVFTEVVESLLAVEPDEPVEVEDAVGPDFVLNLAELLMTVRESGARLKASGALTGPAAQRIITKLNRAELPLMTARDHLELLVICGEKLGLIERIGDSLEVLPAAWAWESRSYEEKAADLFKLLGSAVPVARSVHHHEALCETARAFLRELDPCRWRPGAALAAVPLRRYLAGLRASGLRGKIEREVAEVDKYVLPPFPTVRQLAKDLHQSVVMEAYAMGIIDLAGGDENRRWLRLCDFGAVAAGHPAPQRPPAKLIAMPDFEVIVLPEGDTTRLRYELGQFTARAKFEKTYHLRIEKDRVEEAVVRGMTADAMIALLESHAETPVPQNVEFSIRSWAERIRVASVGQVYLMELGDERLLDVVAKLPELEPLVVRRASPTALALSGPPTDRKLLSTLRSLGVFIR